MRINMLRVTCSYSAMEITLFFSSGEEKDISVTTVHILYGY